ncbi:MAG: sensor histidine kinase [Rhodobacteraceae bacterium]|nr:sensor histidine kinase [Paracoccaceae bacterium]
MASGATIRGSLRTRLMLLLIGSSAILAIILFVLVRSFAVQIAQQSQDRILLASATSILEAATVRNGEVEIDIPYSAFAMLNTKNDDRVFYKIEQDGVFLSGYEGLISSSGETDSPMFKMEEFNGNVVRVVSESRRLSDDQTTQTLVASVAQTRDSLADTLQDISRTAGILGFGFFVLATALSLWSAAYAIRPLNRMANTVARRGPQDLRAVTQSVPKEMGPLVGALNRLMGRLGASLTQSEDFIAEAAHRVRTPLATVRSHAEATLQRVNKEENRSALRAMIRAIDESSRAAGQLLDHAMVTFRADQIATENVDLGDLCGEIVDRLRPLADMKDIEIALDVRGPAKINGDPILLQNAVRNLIDNALKYSPAESEITLALWTDDKVRLEVRDQGPGFPKDQIEQLPHRFTRGSNAKGTIGSGLGLTIAQDVVTAHKGEMVISNAAEGGGACVNFSFALQ